MLQKISKHFQYEPTTSLANIIQMLKATVSFIKNNPYASAMVMLYSIAASAVIHVYYHLDNLTMMFVRAIPIAYLMLIALSHHVGRLDKKTGPDNNEPDWEVKINGISVGIISDAQYATIRRDVLLDARTYAAQTLNVANVITRIANTLFVSIPLLVFWGGLACFFFAPNTFAMSLSILHKVTPQQITATVNVLIEAIAITSVLLVSASLTVSNQLGLTNQFDLATKERVRLAVKCANLGTTMMVQQEKQGVPCSH